MSNKVSLLEELYKRYDWYMLEASEEEINPAEIDRLVELIEALEGQDGQVSKESPDDQKRKEISDGQDGSQKNLVVEEHSCEGSILKVQTDDGKIPETGRIGRKRNSKRALYRVVGAAAAVIVVSMLLTLNIGTYATKQMGLFQLIQTCMNSGEYVVMGKGDGVGVNVDNEIFFNTWESLEETTGKIVMKPSYITDGMKLTGIEMISTGVLLYVHSRYEDIEHDEHFDVVIKEFEGIFLIARYITDDYKPYEEIEIDGKDLTIYQYDDEYVACFYQDNLAYMVSSNANYEEFEKILKNFKKN